MANQRLQFLARLGFMLLLMPYVLYVGFAIYINQGPIDYETFMNIGQRLITGREIYGENSYYPMPYVMIFAFFSWLPRPLSLALWMLGPVIIAAAISRWSSLVLLFAPVFGHCVGGQSAVVGLVGWWGYRQHSSPQDKQGGVWLGVLMIKPQLGLVPLGWALTQWWGAWRKHKRIPAQAWSWAITTLLIYLPGFLILPDWPWRWLNHPRPLFERALSGFVPRTLLALFDSTTGWYWVAWSLLSSGLLIVVWLMVRRKLTLDLVMLWGFVVSPLVHDYDLIQLTPTLDTTGLRWLAVLLSLPGWAVILLAYNNDAAWYWFTLIAPGLLAAQLHLSRKSPTAIQALPMLQSAP